MLQIYGCVLWMYVKWYTCVCVREREREFKEGHVENKIFTYMS